ncbi:MAG: LysR family transcriptional regulator [Alphaproteobacteria bacterium]|nr:LysR family transcriptional regulator [Alphaproteobacteria bacterium]
MNNNLGDLQTFARAAELGSLTRAAYALGLTPSAVSRSLQRLEDRLGARLLYRTTRSVSLTEEGTRFHQRVLQLFSDLEEAEAEARGQPGFISGTLKVSTFTAFGPHQLLKLLPEFTRRHPSLKIDLDFTDRRVDLAAEGIDVAIRLGTLGDSSLTARKVAWTTRVICAAPEYLERKGLPKTPADLARHDCLAFREPGLVHLNDWPFDTPNGRIMMPVFGPIVAGDGDTVFRLAEAGLGIARLSRFVAAAGIRTGRLVPLLQDFEVADETPLHVVYPHKRHLPPKVAAFIGFLVESFGVVPPWERAA